MAGTLGHQSRFAYDTDSTFDALSVPLEFNSFGLAIKQAVLETAGIRGTRSHPKERTRFGLRDVSGTIVWNPSPRDLDTWLPLILGTAELLDVFALAETVIEFFLLADLKADVFRFDNCKVSRAVFRAAAGQLLELSVDVVAKNGIDGQTWPATIPALSTGSQDAPYVYSDFGATGVTLGGSTRADVLSFEITVDNAVNARYATATTAHDLLENDRMVTVVADIPWVAANINLYDQALAGAQAIFLLTNAAMSLKFDCAALQITDQSPTMNAKREVVLRLTGVARKSGATNELIVTSDSTP